MLRTGYSKPSKKSFTSLRTLVVWEPYRGQCDRPVHTSRLTLDRIRNTNSRSRKKALDRQTYHVGIYEGRRRILINEDPLTTRELGWLVP